jgi:hypothetical protein
MTRHNFTKPVMIARFRFCGGRCEAIRHDTGERCNIKLVRWECHHEIPDALGGKPTVENARCLCIPCHKAVTPINKAYIAEACRREAKNIGVPWPKPIIRNRGFAKTEKPHREPRQHLPPRQLYQ